MDTAGIKKKVHASHEPLGLKVLDTVFLIIFFFLRNGEKLIADTSS